MIVSVLFPYKTQGVATVTVSVRDDVEGIADESLLDPIVTLELSDTSYSFVVEDDEDITSWFTNIPYDIEAHVYDYYMNELYVEFTGTCPIGYKELIEVVIPGQYIHDESGNPLEGTLSNDPEIDGKYYIIEGLIPSIEYDRPSTVSGYVGEDLIEQYVYIKLTDDTYTDDIYEKILSTYNGLTATAIEVIENGVLKVKYTGIPEFEDHSLIHTTILKDYLSHNPIDMIVPDREDVLFDIRIRPVDPEPEIPETPVYSIPTTGIE